MFLGVRSRLVEVAFSFGLLVASQALAAPEATSPNAASPATNTTVPIARIRQGVVEVRLQNKTVALGMILDGDGRILTALSPLGRGIGITARYADGTTALLRVVHSDRAWDLALLSPSDQRYTTGLLASKRDPLKDAVKLKILRLDATRQLKLGELGAAYRENLTGGDAAQLARAMTFRPTLPASDAGSPIVDENGDVVGLAAQACLPTTIDRCVPVVFAVPTGELKRFVREGAGSANAPLPWLGITVASESSSVVPAARIVTIGQNSPAATLGLRAGKQGDILMAVDGTPVGSPQELAEVLHRHRTGDHVTLLLLAEGRYREVRVTLGRYPEVPKPTAHGQEQPDLGY